MKTRTLLLSALLLINTPAAAGHISTACTPPDAEGVQKCTEKYTRFGFELHREFWIKKIHGRWFSYTEYPELGSKPTPYSR